MVFPQKGLDDIGKVKQIQVKKQMEIDQLLIAVYNVCLIIILCSKYILIILFTVT